MKTIANESVVTIDVDDTLIMWGKAKKGEKVIAITNPHDGSQDYVRFHKGHIKILKERKARGAFIIVWSAGGYAWAEAVVKALYLQNYVDLIMSKPIAHIDDKQPNEFMGEHIYLPYGSGYGE